MREDVVQFVRFAVVGLATNALGYGAYLFLTHTGVGPKLAMTIVYGAAVLQSFVLNKSWSFQFNDAATAKVAPTFARYFIVYGLGYVVNLLGLVLLVERMRVPHQLAQGVMIVVVAFMLFVAQRYWVFAARTRGDAA